MHMHVHVCVSVCVCNDGESWSCVVLLQYTYWGQSNSFMHSTLHNAGTLPVLCSFTYIHHKGLRRGNDSNFSYGHSYVSKLASTSSSPRSHCLCKLYIAASKGTRSNQASHWIGPAPVAQHNKQLLPHQVTNSAFNNGGKEKKILVQWRSFPNYETVMILSYSLIFLQKWTHAVKGLASHLDFRCPLCTCLISDRVNQSIYRFHIVQSNSDHED